MICRRVRVIANHPFRSSRSLNSPRILNQSFRCGILTRGILDTKQSTCQIPRLLPHNHLQTLKTLTNRTFSSSTVRPSMIPTKLQHIDNDMLYDSLCEAISEANHLRPMSFDDMRFKAVLTEMRKQRLYMQSFNAIQVVGKFSVCYICVAAEMCCLVLLYTLDLPVYHVMNISLTCIISRTPY